TTKWSKRPSGLQMRARKCQGSQFLPPSKNSFRTISERNRRELAEIARLEAEMKSHARHGIPKQRIGDGSGPPWGFSLASSFAILDPSKATSRCIRAQKKAPRERGLSFPESKLRTAHAAPHRRGER